MYKIDIIILTDSLIGEEAAMRKYFGFKKEVVVILISLVLIFSLVACGGSKGGDASGPEGTFKNTQKDEDNGEGFQLVDEDSGYGYMTFNSDGTGKWEYALENDIEWKLKGNKLTIVEKWEDADHGDQEETYTATWDGEEIVLDVWGLSYLFVKVNHSASSDGGENTDNSQETANSTTNMDATLVGSYEGIGSDMQGMKLDPNGEWLKLNNDGTGIWFLGVTEDTFAWASDGSEIYFDVDVEGSDSKMQYSAIVEGEEIILDTGMLYYFAKEGSERSSTVDTTEEKPIEPAEENVATGYAGWGSKPLGSIQVPCDWYGVLQLTNCEGFDFEEIEYDIWGVTDEDSDGGPYFELWTNPNEQGDPVLSIYIDKEETEWLTPIITDGNGFVDLDGGSSDVYQTLSEDNEWSLLSQYIDGAIDIYHGYFDDEGRYADCRFFVRENGTGWHEDTDPLPPSYEDYKKEFSHINVQE